MPHSNTRRAISRRANELISKRSNPWSLLRQCAFFRIQDGEVTTIESPDRSGKGRHWFQVSETREQQWHFLIGLTAQTRPVPNGIVAVNTFDIPVDGPVLNFCKPRGSDYQLIPNFRFGYDDITFGIDSLDSRSPEWENVRRVLREQSSLLPISQRRPAAFLNGLINSDFRLEYLSRAVDEPRFLAARMFVGGPHGPLLLKRRRDVALKAAALGYTTETSTPFLEHLNFAINVYADGNTLSDRMRLLLHTGSAVVAYRSHYEEHYSRRLERSGAVEIIDSTQAFTEIVGRCQSHSWLEEMAGRANDFTDSYLTVDHILDDTADSLTRYFNRFQSSPFNEKYFSALRTLRRPFSKPSHSHGPLR